MSDRILIGTGQATNQKGEIIEIKIYLGNVVELPDGSQTSLSEEQYAMVLERWTREQVKIEGAPKEENLKEPDDPLKGKKSVAEADIDNKSEEENNTSRPINIQYFDQKSGTLSETPPVIEDPPVEKEHSQEEIKHDEENINLEKPPKKTDKKLINLFLTGFIFLLVVAGFLLVKVIYPSLDGQVSAGTPTIEPSPVETTEQIILRATKDISQGDVFTEEMIVSYKISDEEFNQMNAATYISTDGTTTNSSLLTEDKSEDILGKFATRNIPEGTYLTHQDYSSQKVIAEKTFIEVEVDGQTVSVPVDGSALTGNTRVKIVALVTTDNQEETIAIALSEFILEDRSLTDIFDSAGQSILEQLAGQSSNDTTTE